MRTAHFEIPEHMMSRFAEELISRRLDNTITGVTRDEEIEIEVDYDRNEAAQVDELEALLEQWIEEDEKEEEEEEENQ
jgi:hypothetical protein